MAIGQVTAGRVVRRTKINELVSAVGSLELSWVNFNGADGSIRDSGGNIASVTREAAGQYRINFTTLRASINYAVKAACTATSGNDTGYVQIIAFNRAWARIQTRNDDGGIGDPTIVCLIVIGPDPNNRSTALSAISLANASVIDTVTPPTPIDTAFATYKLRTDGMVETDRSVAGTSVIGQWIEDVTEVDSFEVRATFLAGLVPSGSPFGSWLDLASERFWTLANSTYATWSTFRLDIRDKASLQVRGTANITLSVQQPSSPGGGGS